MKPSAGNPVLTWACTKDSQNLLRDLLCNLLLTPLNLTWVCTKASWNLFRKFLQNPVAPALALQFLEQIWYVPHRVSTISDTGSVSVRENINIQTTFSRARHSFNKMHDDFMKYIHLNIGVRQSSFEKETTLIWKTYSIILKSHNSLYDTFLKYIII